MRFLNLIKRFKKDEDGAVTVDWVVLTAAVGPAPPFHRHGGDESRLTRIVDLPHGADPGLSPVGSLDRSDEDQFALAFGRDQIPRQAHRMRVDQKRSR